jgi:hypothetical protein
MNAVGGLFGGAKKPKPDPAIQESQRRQEERLQRQEDEEDARLRARQRLVAGAAARRGAGTLFYGTGETGVSKLGG